MIDIKEIENKIINADCLDILKQLPDKCIDLVLTDPPYNIGQDGGKGWDKIDNYVCFIKAVYWELKRISKRRIIFLIILILGFLKNWKCPKKDLFGIVKADLAATL